LDFLARKISRAKWEPTPYTGPEGIRADAVTGPCLRTYNDTLSLWRCSQDDTDVAEIVLALASAMEKIETIHLILLHQNDLTANGFTLAVTPENANIPVADLRNRHVDLANLTATQILFLAQEIATKVRRNSGFYLFTKKAICEILCKAVRSGRINLSGLKDKVRDEVLSQL
jgi:hypothetical protein